jgi:phenylpropionate dioxygenase-like ring-hydroxylating dioxygenase large terminal subunit
MNGRVEALDRAAKGGRKLADHERAGLPGWTYSNSELFELEAEQLFRRHWQLVGHASEIAEPGQYMSLDMVGERALSVRGKDGKVRSFHNVCRHRGSRVVADERGRCKSAIVCPFHGWAYNLDGTLRGTPAPRALPELDPERHGLKALEQDIWNGFVFVRFKPGPQPAVRHIMSPFEELFAQYGLDRIEPLGDAWRQEIAANWKAVRDVDNEGYHVPVAHPALYDLYGRNYIDHPMADGVSRSTGSINEPPGRKWSVRHYRKIRPEPAAALGAEGCNWNYVGMFPNLVFSLYPEHIGFYQEWPVSCALTVQRGRQFALPDDRREMKLARYLALRIDRETGREDTQLIIWSSEAARSSGYQGTILSELEAGVKAYHDALRELLPVCGLSREPEPGSLARANALLLAPPPA